MTETTDPDLTLPSVAAALPGSYSQEQVVLTVVFHRDTDRIGDNLALPDQGGPWLLGRYEPDFGAIGKPLLDRHVSRRALRMRWQGRSLEVGKLPDSSRCRLGAAELREPVVLSREQLAAGVPLVLGNAVVLLLRLGSAIGKQEGPESVLERSLRGKSAYMVGLRAQVTRAAASDGDVLIRGETGTGKDVVANAIHSASRRTGEPLVTVNMAAIPTELAAASLFGNAKGAYTGADRARDGYFQQASGGSLFLDEIGDTPVEIQPQLLRALQQREIQPVGGPVQRLDFRVISATDATLEGSGSDFKAALLYRLGDFEIVLRPLREHPEDIGELLWHFLSRAAKETGQGDVLPRVDSESRDIAAWAEIFRRFLCYHWPGNVRELANYAGQILLASSERPNIPDAVQEKLATAATVPEPTGGGSEPRPMKEVSDAEFDRVYAENDFEIAPTTRQLRVSRGSFYRYIEASPHYRLASDIPGEEIRRVMAECGGDLYAAARKLKVSASSLRARLRNLDSAEDQAPWQ